MNRERLTMHSPEQIALARQMYIDGATGRAHPQGLRDEPGHQLYYWLDGGPADGDLHLEPLPRRARKARGNESRRRRAGDA